MWATHYYIHKAPPVPEGGVPFRDKSGTVLSDNVSYRDWCFAAIEGIVQVSYKGQVGALNYGSIGAESKVYCSVVLHIDPKKKKWIISAGKSQFAIAKGEFCDAVMGSHLVHLRTIAVDKSLILFGAVIYSRCKGAISLPSGVELKHDGYFFSGDTGGPLRGVTEMYFAEPHLRIACQELFAEKEGEMNLKPAWYQILASWNSCLTNTDHLLSIKAGLSGLAIGRFC